MFSSEARRWMICEDVDAWVLDWDDGVGLHGWV
jgi:hypothetical protein